MTKKVMVIDDDKEYLEELKELLILSGYETVSVSNGLKAFELVRILQPDIVLLDLKMDSKSGLEIADELSHHPNTSSIPVVAMTGFYTEEEHKKLMVDFGVKRCLLKPFHPLDVIAEIEFVVSQDSKGLHYVGFREEEGDKNV